MGTEMDRPLLDGSSKSDEEESTPINLHKKQTVSRHLPLGDLYSVVVMSFGFLVLFVAMGTSQDYLTSLVGDLGNYSLAILYIIVGPSSILTCAILSRLGERLTAVVASTCYAVFIASLIYPMDAIVIIASVIVGTGTGWLWVTQGTIMTKCSHNRTRGRNMGIFWCLYNVSTVLGNLGTYFIFDHVSTHILFAILTGCAFASVLVFSCISQRQVDELAVQHGNIKAVDAGKVIEHPTVKDQVKRSMMVFKSRDLLRLIPHMMWTGLEYSFWNGEFPRLLDKNDIGLVLSAVGIAEMGGGLFFGWLSDRLGRHITVMIGLVFSAAALLIIGLGLIDDGDNYNTDIPLLFGVPFTAFIVALLLGCADAIGQTALFALCGELMPSKSAGAFMMIQIFQNGASAIGFALGVGVPVHGKDGSSVQLWLQAGLVLVATLLFVQVEVGKRRANASPAGAKV